jgi:hypothetical protein
MVICPIALAVHCTGCPFFKFCPAKPTLGDYKEEELDKTSKTKKTDEDNMQSPGEKPGDSSN